MSTVILNSEECKGCGLCVEACPPKVLHLSDSLNRYGYHPAAYAGKGCTGCGICYFACPEPGGIRVLRAVAGTSRRDPQNAPKEQACLVS